MPNLFNGFCYPTLSDAVDAEISLPLSTIYTGTSSFTTYAYSFVSSPFENTALINIRFTSNASTSTSLFPLNPSSGNIRQIQKYYPPCTSVGSSSNSLGLSMADASSLFFAVIAVWAVAWSFKTLRRAM